MSITVRHFGAMLAFYGLGYHAMAQQPAPSAKADTSWKQVYRGSAPRINDLVHTKLDVRFDYDKSYLYGKAWLTLQPHFYATDTLTLDAKGMDIHKVTIVKGTTSQPLKYAYDGMQLHIQLDHSYKGHEQYTIYIDYTSKPNDLKVEGSAAITDARGLYFINPKGEDKEKPTQIWTQGETEANSVWFPTIDKSDQKSTEEITMTVPAKYVTLSNGLLVTQKKNADGTRTDTWKMDLPHAPYLFFMGVGEYSITKDSYKGKEVSYYVEKAYAPVARRIFGNTPEMIAFYSKTLGVDFPWAKYSQIVGRDYVSGAMENTTSTLHQESAQQNARELTDGNSWESTIAHELFHQWFGDLVTCESWSNLTVNESFANYSETLWAEYKYGKDAGRAQNYDDMQGYLGSGSANKNLVRFYYRDKEDMFDAVSYNKGGRILNMLRTYVGDSAFFKSLNVYLTTNKFKTGEAQQLRLAFEEVTGQDLNWFWNQWYYGSGHPQLTIDYAYDDASKRVTVTIKQTQTGDKTFKLPFAIDVYNGAKKTRYDVWMDQREQTYILPYGGSKPELVNVDGDKALLCDKKDNKTAANFAHQYKYAGNYNDRKEAIEYAAEHQDDASVRAYLVTALNDAYFGLRNDAIDAINPQNADMATSSLPVIEKLAASDQKAVVRAKALEVLSQLRDSKYMPLFQKAVKDSSYSVSGAALTGISTLDPSQGLAEAKKQKGDAKGKLAAAISKILIETGAPSDFAFIAEAYDQLPAGQAKFDATPKFCEFLTKVSDLEQFKSGVTSVLKFRTQIPATYDNVRKMILNMLKNTGSKKKAAGQTAFSDYVENAISELKD